MTFTKIWERTSTKRCHLENLWKWLSRELVLTLTKRSSNPWKLWSNKDLIQPFYIQPMSMSLEAWSNFWPESTTSRCLTWESQTPSHSSSSSIRTWKCWETTTLGMKIRQSSTPWSKSPKRPNLWRPELFIISKLFKAFKHYIFHVMTDIVKTTSQPMLIGYQLKYYTS